VNKWLGRVAIAAMVSFGAGRAGAQITTVIAPPKPNQAKQVEVARREQAAQDSVARVTLTDMKQWVDSAAGALAIRPDTGTVPAADAAAARPAALAASPVDSASGRVTASAGSSRAEFRDGVRAPDTATPIPSIAVLGSTLLILGLALRTLARRTQARRAEP
jgi:hypothetical protein